jgi:hypothetical protein
VSTIPTDQTELRDVVRAKYAAAATATTERDASCCGPEGAIITKEQREQFGYGAMGSSPRATGIGCHAPVIRSSTRTRSWATSLMPTAVTQLWMRMRCMSTSQRRARCIAPSYAPR